MSADWVLIDADLSSYSSIKFKSGGRLYFLKAGRKNVSIYDLALRKNVSLKLSALPLHYFELNDYSKKFHKNTWKSILRDFRGYTKKTRNEKDILDTLKKIKLKVS